MPASARPWTIAKATSWLGRSSSSTSTPGFAASQPASGVGQVLLQRRRVRQQPDVTAQAAARVLAQLAAQAFHLLQDEAGVVGEGEARRCRPHAAPAAIEQRRSQGLLHPAHPGAGRRECQPGTGGTGGDAALLRHGGEQAQVGEVEVHGTGKPGVGSPAYAWNVGSIKGSRIVPVGAGAPWSVPCPTTSSPSAPSSSWPAS